MAFLVNSYPDRYLLSDDFRFTGSWGVRREYEHRPGDSTYTVRVQVDASCAECEQEWAKQQAAYEAAEARAATLLLTYLSPEQAKQYQQDGYFDLVGSLGGQYRIRPGYTYNVERRDGAGVVKLCAGPAAGVPKSDVMLAQYLALVSDEAGFLSIANPQGRNRGCGCYLCQPRYFNSL